MTGYAVCMGRCVGCGNVFSFNPLSVPSSSAGSGQREPFPPPLPDAYEPIEEGQL